jgi:hypothetical protein
MNQQQGKGSLLFILTSISFDARLKGNPLTMSVLTEHYRQRELKPDTVWKTYSTKRTYEGYLSKSILLRWGNYLLTRINAGEVELWFAIPASCSF